MICNICNTNNSVNATYCKHCGKPMEDSMKTCPNGHNFSSKFEECPFCPKSNIIQQNKNISFDDDKTVISNYNRDYRNDNMDKAVISSININNDFEKTLISDNNENQRLQKDVLVGWLVIYSLDKFVADYKLFKGTNKVGRAKNNDIIITDEFVFGEHCSIICDDDKITI